MDLELTGKTALITGASRGIGRAIAASLASENCNLLLCARGAEALEATAHELRVAHGVRVETAAADITQPDVPARLVESARQHFGSLHILVGNAGGNSRGRFEDTTDEAWAEIMDLNVYSHLRTARAAIPVLKASGGGSMIFVASIFGREAGGAGLSIYNTTKSALISAAKIMAVELGGDKIRVNTVAPGSIRFPGGSWDKRVQADPEAMKQFVAANIPMGRFGRADEVADVVSFLASARASWVSGACLTIDGVQSHSLI